MTIDDPFDSLQTLRESIRQFVSERDWHQFHHPKNLSMSIAIEAAELMQCFQWSETNESIPLTEELRGDPSDELADILIYCLVMADALGIEDLKDVVLEKLDRAATKYPIDKYNGQRP